MTDDITTINDPFADPNATPAYNGGDPFDMDAAFDNAPVPSGGSGDLPAGKYIGYVWIAQHHTINKGDHAGQPMAKLGLRVMDGPLRGHTQDRAYFFKKPDPTTPNKMPLDYGFFKGDIATMGIDLAALGMTFSQFVYNGLEHLRLRVVEFEVRKSKTGDFTNVYINRLVNGRPIPADLEALDAEGKRAPEGAMAAAAGDDFGAFSLG